jgi:nuclear protein localization family protein 4
MHNDLAESFQLRSTPGWQTLFAILQSTGERVPKRFRDAQAAAVTADSASPATSSPSTSSAAEPNTAPALDGERLAKRFAAFRLNEKRPTG